MATIATDTPVTFPTVHLNGTSRDALREGYCKATAAIRAAGNALAEAGPNARDYYPQGPGAFEAARAQHQSRLDRLAAVREELYQILESLDA
jgi:hypothetical protein